MSNFLMPSLGADMEEATLVEWQAKPGDTLHKGDVIAVVETAKGAIEVEVFEDAEVEELLVPIDTVVPVGQPIARLTGAADRPATPTPAQAPTASKPTKPEAEPKEAPQKAATEPMTWGRLLASPLARKRAREEEIPLSAVPGSGPRGEILARDIDEVARTKPRSEAETKPKGTAPGRFNVAEMRKAIGAAMAKSKREIPHYYLSQSIDMLAATQWLNRYNNDKTPDDRILMSALVFRAVALALRSYPEMNGYYKDGRFEPSEAIHLGVAINIRGVGLITPAILHADHRPLPDLMKKLQDLTQRARQGGLRSSEMTQGTITVTALGERGVDTVYGVIYPPQVAILGFGKVAPRPCAVGDALAVRPVMQATLAADHRVSDGHRGGLFLARIEHLLQHPEYLSEPTFAEPTQ